jgi:hypothetical protein
MQTHSFNFDHIQRGGDDNYFFPRINERDPSPDDLKYIMSKLNDWCRLHNKYAYIFFQKCNEGTHRSFFINGRHYRVRIFTTNVLSDAGYEPIYSVKYTNTDPEYIDIKNTLDDTSYFWNRESVIDEPNFCNNIREIGLNVKHADNSRCLFYNILANVPQYIMEAITQEQTEINRQYVSNIRIEDNDIDSIRCYTMPPWDKLINVRCYAPDNFYNLLRENERNPGQYDMIPTQVKFNSPGDTASADDKKDYLRREADYKISQIYMMMTRKCRISDTNGVLVKSAGADTYHGTVYRGMTREFVRNATYNQYLIQNFLSTSTNVEQAIGFATDNGFVYVLTVAPGCTYISMDGDPFVSYFPAEEEILFNRYCYVVYTPTPPNWVAPDLRPGLTWIHAVLHNADNRTIRNERQALIYDRINKSARHFSTEVLNNLFSRNVDPNQNRRHALDTYLDSVDPDMFGVDDE